jgi:hypothetical protein
MINVYITGLPRGGTTLLSSIIGQHLSFEQMGESMYTGILDSGKIRCSCGEIDCPVIKRIFDLAKKNPDILGINKTYATIDRMREPNKISHSMTISAFKDDLIPEGELRIWIKKSCDGLDALVKIFTDIMGNFRFVDNTKEINFAEDLIDRDNWRIILITRDPRGMAWSSKKSGIRKKVPRPVLSKIPVYIDFARRAIQLRRDSRVYFLRYEELCLNPEIQVKRLCKFLEVEYDPKMLLFKTIKGHTLTGNRMRYNPNQKICLDLSWKDGLSQEELRLITENSELARLWQKLDYDFEGELK